MRRWEALADGVLDAGLLVRYESLRPKKDRSPAADDTELNRLRAAILSANVAVFGAPPIDGLGSTGGFKLQLMELSSGQVTQLTDTTDDESPSFSPNGRMIMYATRLQGREALMTTTLDGRIKTRLSGGQGDIRESDWGPFLA